MRRLRIRICILVFERFDKFVEQHCEESAADGTDPVHPLGGVEGVGGDGRTERAGGVERSAGPEDAYGIDVSWGRGGVTRLRTWRWRRRVDEGSWSKDG